MIKNTDERIQRYLTPFRYPEPVLTGSGIAGAFDEMAVDIPFVFRHQNKFYMLYTGLDGKGYSLPWQSAMICCTGSIKGSYSKDGRILTGGIEWGSCHLAGQGKRWDLGYTDTEEN